MIHQGQGAKYPGLLIYAAATYAFFLLAFAIVQLIKYQKYKSPILSAAKYINLAQAMMAMFSLQVAMFASFNADGDALIERIMNSITGGVVCCSIFAMAVIMVVQSFSKLKDFQN